MSIVHVGWSRSLRPHVEEMSFIKNVANSFREKAKEGMRERHKIEAKVRFPENKNFQFKKKKKCGQRHVTRLL